MRYDSEAGPQMAEQEMAEKAAALEAWYVSSTQCIDEQLEAGEPTQVGQQFALASAFEKVANEAVLPNGRVDSNGLLHPRSVLDNIYANVGYVWQNEHAFGVAIHAASRHLQAHLYGGNTERAELASEALIELFTAEELWAIPGDYASPRGAKLNMLSEMNDEHIMRERAKLHSERDAENRLFAATMLPIIADVSEYGTKSAAEFMLELRDNELFSGLDTAVTELSSSVMRWVDFRNYDEYAHRVKELELYGGRGDIDMASSYIFPAERLVFESLLLLKADAEYQSVEPGATRPSMMLPGFIRHVQTESIRWLRANSFDAVIRRPAGKNGFTLSDETVDLAEEDDEEIAAGITMYGYSAAHRLIKDAEADGVIDTHNTAFSLFATIAFFHNSSHMPFSYRKSIAKLMEQLHPRPVLEVDESASQEAAARRVAEMSVAGMVAGFEAPLHKEEQPVLLFEDIDTTKYGDSLEQMAAFFTEALLAHQPSPHEFETTIDRIEAAAERTAQWRKQVRRVLG